MFLIGAGVPGGVSFMENIQLKYFLYGIIMTLVPMIIGFLVAKYVFKLSIFNNLGSITGGMTSTPALDALIRAPARTRFPPPMRRLTRSRWSSSSSRQKSSSWCFDQ